MRKQFIFDPHKETATAYLTRMSPILGALRNDGASVVNQQLVSSIGSEEQKEIENEMCKAFEKTICTETRRAIKMTPGKLDDYEDDYKNELRIAILKDIHKFNNPAYLQGAQTFSIDAFVRARVPGVTKKIIGMKRGRKEYEMKRESHVKKIMAALTAIKGTSTITVDEILNNQELANDSMTLSKDQIWDVMAAMEDASYLEDLTDYEADYRESKFSSVDQQGVIDDFMKDLAIFPEYEMYIYLQSLRLRLDETTNKEIACDKRLIDLCKASPDAKDKVIYERIVIERPKSGIAPNSAFDEYVSTTYIETTYRKIDRNVRSAFIRKELEESDMLAILNYLINM